MQTFGEILTVSNSLCFFARRDRPIADRSEAVLVRKKVENAACVGPL